MKPWRTLYVLYMRFGTET